MILSFPFLCVASHMAPSRKAKVVDNLFADNAFVDNLLLSLMNDMFCEFFKAQSWFGKLSGMVDPYLWFHLLQFQLPEVSHGLETDDFPLLCQKVNSS